MIAFAFIGPDGLPTGGGIRPQLPDGGIALTAPFTTADLPRLRWTGRDWVTREVSRDPPPSGEEVLQKARDEARQRINARADHLRRTQLTDIAGQDAIYQAKRAEALAYLREAEMTGEPASLADYPWLQAELGVTAPTAWQLAQIWLHLSDAAAAALIATEGQRQADLQRIAAATDIAAIEAVLYRNPERT